MLMWHELWEGGWLDEFSNRTNLTHKGKTENIKKENVSSFKGKLNTSKVLILNFVVHKGKFTKNLAKNRSWISVVKKYNFPNTLYFSLNGLRNLFNFLFKTKKWCICCLKSTTQAQVKFSACFVSCIDRAIVSFFEDLC